MSKSRRNFSVFYFMNVRSKFGTFFDISVKTYEISVVFRVVFLKKIIEIYHKYFFWDSMCDIILSVEKRRKYLCGNLK